ncbi:MAG: hypothetical protein R3343_06535 [Nitriliruptorales bacterium]|nr:hypothetical protein [Nitriliruptorales bacterium]
MRLLTRAAVLLSALAVAVLLSLSPALATESGDGSGGGGGGEEREKIELPSSPRDQVGLVLIVLMGLGGLLAADNMRRQLKGERKQATGEWRWR